MLADHSKIIENQTPFNFLFYDCTELNLLKPKLLPIFQFDLLVFITIFIVRLYRNSSKFYLLLPCNFHSLFYNNGMAKDFQIIYSQMHNNAIVQTTYRDIHSTQLQRKRQQQKEERVMKIQQQTTTITTATQTAEKPKKYK